MAINNAAVETAKALFPKFLFAKSSSSEVSRRVKYVRLLTGVVCGVWWIYAADTCKVAIYIVS